MSMTKRVSGATARILSEGFGMEVEAGFWRGEIENQILNGLKSLGHRRCRAGKVVRQGFGGVFRYRQRHRVRRWRFEK